MLWGLVHAILFLSAAATLRLRQRLFAGLPAIPLLSRLSAPLQVFSCLSLISFAWLFFRVEDSSDIQIIARRTLGWLTAGAPLSLGLLFSETDSRVFPAILAVTLLLESSG
jgi:hypothetical protein